MIFYAKNIQEALFHLKNVASLRVVGGMTGKDEVGEKLLCARTVGELCTITRDERSIDFGAASTLEEALALGERRFPALLFSALKSVGNPFVRSRATIAGNILAKKGERTLLVPLLALEASLKFQSSRGTFSVPLRRFTQAEKGSLLTAVQVPLEEYAISVFHRVKIDKESPDVTFAFAAALEKNIIRKVSAVFGSKEIFISMLLPRLLSGRALPLRVEEAESFVSQASGEAIALGNLRDEEGKLYTSLIKSVLYELT